MPAAMLRNNSQNKKSMTEKAGVKIALVAYHSLGDGLIFLSIADNLRRSGYDITYFSHFISQLSTWLPQLDIRPFPNHEQWENELNRFDIVLMDAKAPYMHCIPPEQYPELGKRFIFIAATRVDHRLIHDVSETLRKKVPPSQYPYFSSFAQVAGPIKSPNPKHTIVDSAVSFCRDKLALKQVQAYPDFYIPFYLKHRLYKKRIIISPMSPNPNKNWTAEQFIRLGHELHRLGYEPFFVVAPSEHRKWSERLNQQFPLPLFPRIDQLAGFIYESGALIANDSGNGHLASILNIPTITLYKKNKPFSWRPGWCKGKVVTPKFTLKIFGQRYWKPFIYQSQIIQALETLLNEKDKKQLRIENCV